MVDVFEVKSGDHVAVFSNHQPMVSWVDQLASKSSVVAGQFLCVLAPRLKMKGASPLTLFHIARKQNSMTNILSRSFGSEPKWHFKTDTDILLFLNNKFHLPNKVSWTMFHPTKEICMKLISWLWMEVTNMEEWNQPGKIGKHTGEIGAPLLHLWEWILSYRIPHFDTRSAACQYLGDCSEQDILVRANKSKLAQLLALSLTLERRFLWPIK